MVKLYIQDAALLEVNATGGADGRDLYAGGMARTCFSLTVLLSMALMATSGCASWHRSDQPVPAGDRVRFHRAAPTDPGKATVFEFDEPLREELCFGWEEFESDAGNSSAERMFYTDTSPVPPGTTAISITGRSADSFICIVLKDRTGFPLIVEQVESGGHDFIADLPRRDYVLVTFRRSDYPDAGAAILVQGDHHRPNPDLPSGSEVDFFTQDFRSVGAGPLDENEAGEVDVCMTTIEEGTVVELWGWNLEDAEPMARLLAHRAVEEGRWQGDIGCWIVEL